MLLYAICNSVQVEKSSEKVHWDFTKIHIVEKNFLNEKRKGFPYEIYFHRAGITWIFSGENFFLIWNVWNWIYNANSPLYAQWEIKCEFTMLNLNTSTHRYIDYIDYLNSVYSRLADCKIPGITLRRSNLCISHRRRCFFLVSKMIFFSRWI